jgi:hypothetical protein
MPSICEQLADSPTLGVSAHQDWFALGQARALRCPDRSVLGRSRAVATLCSEAVTVHVDARALRKAGLLSLRRHRGLRRRGYLRSERLAGEHGITISARHLV